MFYSQRITISASRIKRLYITSYVHKNQVGKKEGIKMEMTMQEKLIQFINNLTDEKCEMIVAYLSKDDASNISA